MNVNSLKVIGLEYQDPESFETPIVANPQFENCYCRDHVLFEFNSFHRMAQLLHINRPQMFALQSHTTWATGLFIIWLGVNMFMFISIYENMTTIFEQYFTINYQEVKSICHIDFFALLNHLSFWHIDMMSSGIFFCNLFISYGHKATTHLWTRG